MYGCWDFFFFFSCVSCKILKNSFDFNLMRKFYHQFHACFGKLVESGKNLLLSWNIEFIFFCSIFHLSCFFADETFDLVVLRRLYAKKKMDSEFRFRSFGNIEKIQGKRTQLKIEQLFLPNVQKKMARYMAALVSSITMIIHKILISKYCDMMLTQKKIALFLHAFKVKISTLTQCIICSSGFH